MFIYSIYLYVYIFYIYIFYIEIEAQKDFFALSRERLEMRCVPATFEGVELCVSYTQGLSQRKGLKAPRQQQFICLT